ncbi:1,4-dihydroxy-2-naphthoate octaprenyltransferase [Bifidobacterium sp. ESL0690]|uniref:1,4-dihydroxy-2-naphthoate octaprenyltransferase n=1 Tax=Bifidobacterium sp. ESL0690 TaxID=2983214 RepID=UPI0023F8BC92|nr:1,4-dihydroxy-2-naphthoate octaprenyltransferase [Bifidobacterium sp. ESL0690]WEV47232.1 1,4-dihydroxy-2-naphthoate octaprenyltransferase [Bifidobacterium sp. ESL0690]
MKNLGLWVNGLRPKTLPASIAPVLVGVAAGYRLLKSQPASCGAPAKAVESCVAEPSGFSALAPGMPWGKFVGLAVLCVVVAFFIQIAANFSNDYSDGIRGTDEGRGDAEVKTAKPQRLTVSGRVKPGQVLAAAGVNAFIACVAGLALTIITGHWWLIALGVLCLLAGWFYVGGKHPYGYAGFGEVGVFIFFGLVAVLGTQYVLTGRVNAEGVLGAVLCGLFSCAILMVNNLRDVEEDKVSGKMTLGVRLGQKNAQTVLFVTYLVPLVVTVVGAFVPLVMLFRHFSVGGVVLAVLAILFALVCIKAAMGLVKSVNAGNFVKALPMCSMTVLLFSIVFIVVEIALTL